MRNNFRYDVFLSYSNQDKNVVRNIAQRLKAEGIRVWFDEWKIRPGDSILAKIEDGLEHSNILVLCMSVAAFESDWAKLESHTFRFRDPLNHNRRLIPLRLDDTPIKGSLAQFSYIDWRIGKRDQEYPKLLEACRTVADSSVKEQIKLMRSDDQVISFKAVDVLKSMDDQRAIDALYEAITDADIPIAAYVAFQLPNGTFDKLLKRVRSDGEVMILRMMEIETSQECKHAGIADFLVSLRGSAVPFVVKALQSEAEGRARNFVWYRLTAILKRIGTDEALSAIKQYPKPWE